jgi:acetyltransferase-like isoleucine patch superfamily enzyme
MKAFIKAVLNALSLVHACLHRLHLSIGASFRHKSIALGHKPGIYGVYLRRNWYKQTLKKCGENLIVGFGSYVVYPTVEIGHNCAIEDNCIVSNCSIGDDVILAANVSIMSGAHHHPVDDLSLKFRDHVNPLSRVRLGDNIWVGTHAVIMSDIGSSAVVAAGAVVTKPVVENSIVAGCPAKFIRYRGQTAPLYKRSVTV